jgi:phytoene dehydrogenase-like protein
LGLLDEGPFIPLTRYACHIDEASGKSLDITWDLDRLEADMVRLSESDRDVIAEFMRGVRAARAVRMEVGKPRELYGPLDGLKMLWDMREAIPTFIRYKMSMKEFVQRLKSPEMRKTLTHFFVPEIPVFFAMVALGQLANGELGVFRGGSSKFAMTIARRFKALGGRVTYNSTVEKILVQDCKAVGIKLANGEEHFADIVVSAADGYSTIYKMLEAKFTDETIENRYKNWPLFRPVIIVSYGVTDLFLNAKSPNLIFLKKPMEIEGLPPCGQIHTRLFHYDPTLAPPGQTVVQTTLETEFDPWWKLKDDRAAYDAAKERLVDETLKRMEPHLPGIINKVVMTDVATPYTIWRYTRNYRGSYEGWLPTPLSTKEELSKTLPGLKNFYMVGQWVEPGGGVPPALFSGRHLVQILCRNEKRPFVVS